MAPDLRRGKVSVNPSIEPTTKKTTKHTVVGEEEPPEIRKGTRLRRSSEKKKLATTAETTQIKRLKGPAKKQLSREKVSGKKKPISLKKGPSPGPEFIGFELDATELLARDILEERVRLARENAVFEELKREMEEAKFC